MPMQETFFPFTILLDDASRQSSMEERCVLINIDHVISIKPINIMTETKLIPGFWVRMSNGKKYRALSIPRELEDLFDASPSPKSLSRETFSQEKFDSGH